MPYFDPFGGAGYGSDGFSWSAALTLDLVRRLGPDEAAAIDSRRLSPHAR